MLTMEKKPEIDLYLLCTMHIERNISALAGTIFKLDPSVYVTKGKTSTEQRFIINRFFTNLLLTYRAIKDVPVHNIIAMLEPSLESDVWFKAFITYVAPFLKDNNVFETVYQG